MIALFPLAAQPLPPTPAPLLPSGATVATWEQQIRPRLLDTWTRALGRFQPSFWQRLRYIPSNRQFREIRREEFPAYTRIELELPVERDFASPHLLLIPRNRPAGARLPAVVAWTSTTPDWREPEKSWGSWLAERGYVVLTGWSFIRGYRDGANFNTGVHERLYERFGHWAPLARMVYDASREAEFLARLPYVDPARIGFMGFSLSAKSALYIAAFSRPFAAVVSIDPFIPLNPLPEGGQSNYKSTWYLDWDHPVGQTTTGGLLAGHDHHELLALSAPRPLLVIGGSGDTPFGRAHSDGRASAAWANRAREVYGLYNAPERLAFLPTADGHHANGPVIDAAWRRFLLRWLPALEDRSQGRR